MCDYCSWIEKLLRAPRIEAPPTVCTNVINDGRNKNVEKTVISDPTILVHGTADSISSIEEIKESLERYEEAAIKAYRELIKGSESVDSIEIAIRYLESQESISNRGDNPLRSKENGAPCIRDAAIMDSDSNVGSVGAVTAVKHPISLAKEVLRNNDHILIVDSGIRNLGINPDDSVPNYNSSEDKFFANSVEADKIESKETKIENVNGPRVYGAVARDRKGRLACGISTYDDRGEVIARSSMSATGTVLGCGIFADAQSCCSVSGRDTAMYTYAPARKIIQSLKRETPVKQDNFTNPEIVDILKGELKKFIDSTGESSIGAAALRIDGEARVSFESKYFPWACCNRGVVTSGCIKDELFTRDIKDLDMPLDCQCH